MLMTRRSAESEKKELLTQCEYTISIDKLLEIVSSYQAKIMELESIAAEAISRPAGVEPHAWSDWKIKDK